MLDDRTYMRETPFRNGWPVHIRLIVINVAAWIVQILLLTDSGANHPLITKYLMLSPDGLTSGFIWQLLTFQFLHSTAGLFHILMNCLMLWMFGKHVEARVGASQFLKLYLLSGVLGGLLQAGGGMFWTKLDGPVLGASAGVFGVIAAFAMIFPEERLFLMLILPIKAKYFLLVELVVSFFGIFGTSDGIAHAAHLGGIIGGVCFVRYVLTGRVRIPDFNFITGKKRPRSKVIDVRPTRESFFKKAKPPQQPEMPTGDFISREVDPILDKIAEHGIHSLTDQERKILEAARSRMSKR